MGRSHSLWEDLGEEGSRERRHASMKGIRVLWFSVIVPVAINVLLLPQVIPIDHELLQRPALSPFGQGYGLSFFAFLIGYPGFSLILSSLIACVPYKDLDYQTRFVRLFLIIMFLINSLFTVGILFAGGLRWIGG